MPKKNKAENAIALYAKIPVAARIENPLKGKKYAKAVRASAGLGLIDEGFDAPDIPAGSIAYHPVFGRVRYRAYPWEFSTERFIAGLKAAEANPKIKGHVIHINSCGGEAFYVHEAFLAVKALKKPCYALIDSAATSGGYYLAAGADRIFATSQFSEIGCIGVMCILMDDSKYYESYGIKYHEYYSNYSPLKNKVANDALDGDGDEFVKRFLDPVAMAFIEDVRSTRPAVSEEAQQGASFLATEAVKAGLIDGIKTFEEVLLLFDDGKPIASVPIDINQFDF